MKRILIPIDFSEQAKRALLAAAQVAQKVGAEIYLLHMIDLPSDQNDLESHADASNPAKLFFLKKVHDQMKKLMDYECLNGLKVHEEVRFHKTFTGIIEYSKELNIDLIIMGSQGASGLKEIFIGSNTEKVVRNSNIPVLVVKKEMKETGLSKFVFASDFPDNIKPAFKRFLEFVKTFDAEIHLLYVNTVHNFEPTKKISTRLREFVSEFTLPKHSLTIYNDVSIERGILNYTADINADAIALVTHPRGGLSNLFNGSISIDLVNHALKPVITFIREDK